MKPKSKWKCGHLPGETLTAVKKYNDKQFVVQSDKTDISYICQKDEFTEPHLSLAHVSKLNSQLTEIKGE